MIRTESEYQEAAKRLKEQAERMKAQEQELKGMDLSKEEIRRGMAPVRSFHEQLKAEVETYARLKRGRFSDLHNFDGVSELLIGLRIARGLSQRDLADRLGVHETQVSRDERNEYHGITVERLKKILEALEVEMVTKVDLRRKSRSSVKANASV
jgi:DNA-binding Xre family transcriptional regulator